MKSIDAEISAVEQRIRAHKVALAYAAGAARQRAAKRLTSPAVLAGAVVLGFLAASMLRKKKTPAPAPDRRKSVRDQGTKKGFALGTLLMTGATWLVRSQFGGPVGLAQFVLDKVRHGRSPATAAPAQIRR